MLYPPRFPRPTRHGSALSVPAEWMAAQSVLGVRLAHAGGAVRLAGLTGGGVGIPQAAGKKLFICTNSQWDYTHVLMNFLLAGGGSPGDARPARTLRPPAMRPCSQVSACWVSLTTCA